MKTACPTCGAEVEFRYDDSFVRICDHCRSAVVRGDRGIETLGRVADLMPIESPLELFASGSWDHKEFLLVGMAQLRQASGGISQEWYAKFDERWGWLAEAQGRYYLTFEYAGVPVPAIGTLRPGAHIGLPVEGQLHEFTVGERGEAAYLAASGELPFRLHTGTAYHFVDLHDGGGGFATIDYGDGTDEPMVYIGRQVALPEIGVYGGEAAPAESNIASQRITCGSCGAPIELFAAGQTQRVVCAYCNELIDLSSGAARLIGKLAEKAVVRIPLGSKGTFAEGEVTVVGYLMRAAEIDGSWYQFEEYLLHAPKLGFRWLACSDGHWSYVQPIAPGAVAIDGGQPKYDGVKFKLFQQSTIKVDRVYGEMYWKVEQGERVYAEDYIAPPAMLSKESTKSEENWSLSTYMKPAEVRAAFAKPDLELDPPISVGANQPYPVHGFGIWIFLGCVALTVVAIIAAVRAKEAVRYQHIVEIPKTGAAATTSSTPTLGAPLPQACRDYKAALDSYLTCDKLPKDARDGLLLAWNTIETQASSQDPGTIAAAEQGCHDALPGLRAGMEAIGCTPPAPAAPVTPPECQAYEYAVGDAQACKKLKASERGTIILTWKTVQDEFGHPDKARATMCSSQAKIVQRAVTKAGCKLGMTRDAALAKQAAAGSGSGSGSLAEAEAGSGSETGTPAGTGAAPGTGAGTRTATGAAAGTGAGSATGSGIGAGTAAGTGAGSATRSGMGAGTAAGTGAGTGTAAGSGMGAGTAAGTGAGTGTGTAAGSGTGVGTAAGAGTGSESGSGSGSTGADATPSEPPGSVFFSDPFDLDGQNIEITFRSPRLTNNWIYVATDLVENATGKVVSFDGGIESYSGVDDGESWSEGDNTANQVIGPLPAGKYILRLETQHGGSGTESVEVTVRQGVFRARYYLLALGVMFLLYSIFGFHAWSFERSRWEQSSFGKAGAPKSPFAFLLIAIGGVFAVIWALLGAFFGGSKSDD